MATIFGCLYEVHIGATWRIRLNHPRAAAMRLFCQITVNTCFYYMYVSFLDSVLKLVHFVLALSRTSVSRRGSFS